MRAAHAVLEGRYEVEREIDDETLVVRDRTDPDAPPRVLRFVEPPAADQGGADALAWELARAREVAHPHVARVLEVGRVDDGRLWFTQEHVDGEDPFQWAPGRSPEEVVLLFAQLLRALGAFHAQGLVTGGARPLRLRVQTDAQGGASTLKLLDPGGLTEERSRTAPTDDPPGGLAPERSTGARLDRRANLFEAGVFLRELLTAATAGSSALGRRRDEASVLAQGEQALALATFVLVLMSPAPDDRPVSVEAALETLAASTGLDLGPLPPRPAALCPGPLVGRDALLGELLGWSRVVLGASADRPGAVRIIAPVSGTGEPPGSEPSLFVLAGEPGSGRRALLDRLAVRTRAAGARVLRGRFGPGQGPFGPFAAAARAVAARPAAEAEAGAEDPERDAGAIVDALLDAARAAPLFIALEDLEEARPAARDLLAALCRRAWVARRFEAEPRPLDEPTREPPPRLLVVATADPALLPAAARALAVEPFARERALAPLPARDLPRLAAVTLGGATCPDALQERLALGARGVPGRVVRIVRDFLAGADAGLAREVSLVDDARRRLGGADPEAQDLARALALLGRPAPVALLAAALELDPARVGDHLRALARDGVVEAWAGGADPAATGAGRARAGSSGRSRRPTLDQLQAAARAASPGGAARWTIAHTALRRALVRGLDRADRRRLAQALERARGEAPATLAARLERCELLTLADDGARLREVAPPVAAALEAVGAHDALAELERALGRLDPGERTDDRHEHRRREVEARFRAGQDERAARLLRRLIDKGVGRWPRLVEAALWRRLTEHHIVATGDALARPALGRARAALEAAAEAAGRIARERDEQGAGAPDMPAGVAEASPEVALERARLAAVAAELHLAAGELADAGAACDEGLDALKVEGIPAEHSLPARARLLGLLGQLAYREDDLAKAEQMLRAGLALLDRLKLAGEAAQALHRLGTVSFARGHVTQAEAHWRAALARAEAARDARAAGAARSSLALAAVRRGSLAEARELLRESLRQRQEVDDAQGCAASLHNLAFVYTCAGALEEAAAAYRESLDLRRALGDRFYAASASNNLGQVLTELGRTAEARAHLDEALAARVEMGDRRGEAATLANLAELDLRACDFAAARARAAQAQRLREEAGDNDDLIDSARRSARIHMALGGLLEAQRAVERAIGLLSDSASDTWHERERDPDRGLGDDGPRDGAGSPLQEAACRLLLGEILVRRGKHDRGRRELERARRAAETVGDRAAARAAAIELAALQLARSKPEDARFLLDSRPVPQPGRMRPLEGREPPDRHGVLRVRERLLRARIELARERGSVFVAARCAEEALEEARRAALRDLEWRALQVLAATAELRGKHEDALALTLETQELVEDILARVPAERRDGYLAADSLRLAALRGDSPVAALGVRLSMPGGPDTDPALAAPPPVLKAMVQPEAGAPTIEPAPVRPAPPAPPAPAAPAAPGGVAREDFAAVVGLNRTIVDEPDVRRAYEAALAAAVRLCRAERGLLCAFGDGGDDLTVLAVVGLDEVDRPRERFARRCAFRAAESGELVLSGDVLVDQPLGRAVHRVGLGLRSVLAAPVTSPDGRRVALYLDHPFQLGRFGQREVELLEVLADQCALLVGREVLESALHRKRGFSPGLEQRRFLEAKATLERPPVVRLGDPSWGLCGRSAHFRAVVATLEEAAPTDDAVLIEGAPGVGKGQVARAVHQLSKRPGPLVVVDLCELAEEHAEVELFGHEAGAFPGADQARLGLLREAGAGTLLFERVTDAPPAVQAKLVRALEERSVRPVGAAAPVPFEARLLATARDVDAAVASGRLRQDLLVLLAMTRVQLAPLDERPEDKGPLVDAVLETWGDGAPTLSGPARAALEARAYPGNARELKAVLRAAAARARGRPLQVDDLPQERATESAPLAVALERFEREYVERALRANAGDLSAAARALGVTRRALKKKLEQLRIEP